MAANMNTHFLSLSFSFTLRYLGYWVGFQEPTTHNNNRISSLIGIWFCASDSFIHSIQCSCLADSYQCFVLFINQTWFLLLLARWHSVWKMITLQISQLINYQHKTVFRNGDNYLEMWYAQRHLHASGIHWMGFYFVIWSQHCISLRDHTVGTCLMVASVSEFHSIKSFCFGKYFISYEMGRCVLKVMTTSTSSVQLISSNLRI